MANVNSLSTNSNSYSSSLYGSRNVISGLATGMDTEAMIENSVSGYRNKIAQLQQQIESITWKQDAYRSITDKMIALMEKFTSYTSKTNLSSATYFSQSMSAIASGAYASRVSATGKTSSDVRINSVTSLATAAKYTVRADALELSGAINASGGTIDWSKTVSSIEGSSMTIKAGGKSYKINFTDEDEYASVQDLAAGIQRKLEDAGVEHITVAAGSDGKITFSAYNEDGTEQEVSVSGVTGALSKLGEKNEDGGFTITDVPALTTPQTMAQYLSGKSINVEFNGVTKSISLEDFAKQKIGDKTVGELTDEDLKDEEITSRLTGLLANTIQDGVDEAFGKGRMKVSEKDGGLSFEAKDSGSTLKVTSGAGEALKIGSGLSNYFNTSKTLGDLLPADYFETDENGESVAKEFFINGKNIGSFGKDATLSSVLSAINSSDAGVKVSFSSLTNQFVFTTTETGANQEIKFGEGLASDLFRGSNKPQYKTLGDIFGDRVKWDENGKTKLYLTTDGESGPLAVEFSKDDSLEYLRNNLQQFSNSIKYDEEKGYSFVMQNGDPYSKEDADSFLIGSAPGTGISFTELIAAANTDLNFKAGTDAVLTATINGKELTMQRSTNTVQIDGLSVTLKGTFETAEGEEAVSFKTSSNTDSIVNDIKSFVDQYNAIMKEIHDAYSTQPLKDNKGNKYSPLTDSDKSSMSDTAIANYEEKAKTGLLFADNDLSTLYGKMRDIFSSFSSGLSELGISTTYSEGLTQVSLDEDKLRAALENDPDKVKNAFTSSKALGGDSDGLMTKVKNLFDTYASKSIATPGILVKKAGTKLSSTSLQSNTMQKQIEKIEEKISSWQTKLNTKIDYYTRQFTALETLMSSLNNQSSLLTSLMGG